MSRAIRVTGKGTLHIKPDMTRLTIDLSGLRTEYDATLKCSADDTNCLRDALVKLGFQSTDLKTLSFDVNTKYKNYRDKKAPGRKRPGAL